MIKTLTDPIVFDEIWVSLNVLNIKPDTYEISNYGNVRRLEDKYPIKAQILETEYGCYRIVNLVTSSQTNRKPKKYLVHRLVGLVFVSNPNNYQQINHINNNGMDELFSNLEWVTPQYNTDYQKTTNKYYLDNKTNYNIYRLIESGDRKSVV